jgi:hypothetical protein
MQNVLRKMFKWRLVRFLIVIIGLYCMSTILGLILGSDAVYPIVVRFVSSSEDSLFRFDVSDG